MKKIILTIMLALLCAGCMTIWVKPPQKEYHHSGLKISAMLPQEWMRFTPDKGLVLTKDGVTLNIMSIMKFRFKDKLEFTKRKFTEDMTPLDLAEVEIDNFKSNTNIAQFEIVQNKPEILAQQQSYFLEYTYETLAGLKIHGKLYGFVFDGHIYRVRFEAADQFYYQKNLNDFDQMVKSIHMDINKDKT